MQPILSLQPDTLPTQQQQPPKTAHPHLLSFLTANLFILLFTLYSFFSWDSAHLNKLNYPADSRGNTCSLDYPHSFPYLYIDLSLATINYRCVGDCPGPHNLFTVTDSQDNTILTPALEEKVNSEMGGVCWSAEKYQIMEKRGFTKEILSKNLIRSNFKGLLYIGLATLILAMLTPILLFFFPFKAILGGTIFIGFTALAFLLYSTLTSQASFFKTQTTIFFILLAVFMGAMLLLNKGSIIEAVEHVEQVKQQFQQGRDSPLQTMLKSLRTSLLLSLAHCFMLTVILLEYLALASSEQITKSGEEIYYTVERSWWKYFFLLFQWLFLSHLLENIYQHMVTRCGYHIATRSSIACPTFSFITISNIYHLSALQTLLWLPLKTVLLFKPQGAILRKEDKWSWGQEVSKCCHCCCGLGWNYLHRLTFNPFLVIAVNPNILEMENCLAMAQESYHQHNPWLDKTSLWGYRCACYLAIGGLSAVLLRFFSLLPSNLNQSAFCHVFSILAVVVTLEVGQYGVTLWSRLAEVNQFVRLVSRRTTPKI